MLFIGVSVTSKYQQHVERWKDCTECDLCNTRKNVVLLRGKIPSKVLFCGEAPGPGEDSLGVPFIGPAGHLLDQITNEAITQLGKLGTGTEFFSSKSFAYTNLIACFPLDDDGTKFTKPPKESITACADRLQECFKVVNPKLVVWLGDDAAKYGPKSLELHKGALRATKFVHIIHPGAILRMQVAQVNLAIKRSVVILRDALEQVI